MILRLQKGHQISQGAMEKAVELKVTQMLGEGHRKKVTRRKISVSFPSLFALAFQPGRKYLKPGRLYFLGSWEQPGNEASLILLSPSRTASSQHAATRGTKTCSECGRRSCS